MGHAIGTTIEDVPAEQRLTTTTSRDIWGRVTTITSPKGASTIMVYDDLGNMKLMEEPALVGSGQATRYSHIRNNSYFADFNGRGFPERAGRSNVVLAATASLKGGTNGALPLLPYEHVVLVAKTQRDNLDRPLTVEQSVQGDNGTQVYAYDTGKERVKSIKGVNNAYTVFFYDSAGRVEKTLVGADSASETAPLTVDSRLERVVYNAAGNVVDRFVTYGGTNTEIHEEQNDYDGFGRLVKSTQVVSGKRTTRVHDAQGRVAGEESADGANAPVARVKYTYHGASGRLSQTEDLLKGTITAHAVSEAALTAKQTIQGLNLTTSRRTDGAGRVVEQFLGVGSSGLASAMEYDADGNLLRSGMGSSFADAQGRISLVSCS